MSADRAIRLSSGMAAKTAARLKKFLSFSLIAARLFGRLALKTFLPEISGNRLDLFLAVLIDLEPPELRHLGTGAESLRIPEPQRNPFLAKFQLHIFQIWSDFLLILH